MFFAQLHLPVNCMVLFLGEALFLSLIIICYILGCHPFFLLLFCLITFISPDSFKHRRTYASIKLLLLNHTTYDKVSNRFSNFNGISIHVHEWKYLCINECTLIIHESISCCMFVFMNESMLCVFTYLFMHVYSYFIFILVSF